MIDRSKLRDHSDDVRRLDARRGRLIVAAALSGAAGAVLLSAFLLVSVSQRRSDPPPRAAAEPNASGHIAGAPDGADADPIADQAAEAKQRASARPVIVRRSHDRRNSGQASRPSNGGDDTPRFEIGAGDYIAALRDAGETGGLAAFSPPGTRPPSSGVIVPDDYELPEGFVRHYQSTDDGRRLEPILMLSPEYDLLDQHGEPIALGQDRIVPPELAPPNLPVRILEIPPHNGGGQAPR